MFVGEFGAGAGGVPVLVAGGGGEEGVAGKDRLGEVRKEFPFLVGVDAGRAGAEGRFNLVS